MSQHSDVPFSYVRTLESYARQHPSEANHTLTPSIIQQSTEPSNQAIVPSLGTQQDITNIDTSTQQDQPPRGIVAQRLYEYLSSQRIDNTRQMSQNQRQQLQEISDGSSDSSSHFSSVTSQLLSPFHIQMQHRLNKIRDSSGSQHLPMFSTPNVPFQAGVNHLSSDIYNPQQAASHSHHKHNHPVDYSAMPIIDPKWDVTSVKNKSIASSVVSRPALLNDRINPPSIVGSQKSYTSIISKRSGHSYYNLMNPARQIDSRNVPSSSTITPIPKPRKHKPKPHLHTPVIPPIPYAGVENIRTPHDQNSVMLGFDSISRNRTFPLPPHELNQTALVPTTHQLPTIPPPNNPPRPLPSTQELPGVSYTKLLEKRYGLKPESAAALVPPFQTPCCLWAEKVRRVLQARGFYNLDDPWLSFALLPFVLGKLPASIAQMAPTTNLAYLLSFIESYDRRTNSLHDVLTKGVVLNMKPSAAFLQRCTEMRRARGPDLDDDAVRQLAWQALSTSLPTPLQAFALTIKASNELPTARQWETMDNLWFDSLSKQELTNKLGQSSVANVESQPKPKNNKRTKTTTINALSNQVTELTAKVDRTISQLNETKPTSSNQFKPTNKPYPNTSPLLNANLSLGISLKDRGIDLTRYPDALYPHRLDLCFYHQAFGKNALKCNQGCAWINKTGKPLRQFPVRKPPSNVASPTLSTTGATVTSTHPAKNA